MVTTLADALVQGEKSGIKVESVSADKDFERGKQMSEFEKEKTRYGYKRQPTVLTVVEAEERELFLSNKFKTNEFINPAEMREYEALRRVMAGYKNPANNITEIVY